MRNHPSDFSQQLAREKALYLYISAFEHGNSDHMDAVLQQAMLDPLLEEMIMEVHEFYLAEEKVTLREQDRAKMLNLVVQYLPSGIAEDDVIAIPPLTIRDVLDKLQENRAVQSSIKQEAQQINTQLSQTNPPLPENLAIKNISHLFAQLGITVSAKLQKMFRENAIFLSMTRQQGIAQLAATRRQKAQYQRKRSQEEDK